MPVKVIMPQLGESVEEGTITKWLKDRGDPVVEYEALLEINTDKVDTEIPSPASGILLERLQEEGSVVAVGTVLAWIGEPGEQIPTGDIPEIPAEMSEPVEVKMEQESERTTAAQPKADEAPTHKPGQDRELGFISPIVARLADENGIDLRRVTGTGLGGRITKQDVMDYIESGQAALEPGPLQAQRVIPAPAIAPPSAAPGDVISLTPVRRAIAEHMLMSKRTSPHVTTVMEVDLSRVAAHRQAHKDEYARRNAVKLTFTAYFIAATVAALKAYPIVNSSWSEEGILLRSNINIGMATSLGEDGLIVPVIKHADGLSLLGITQAINDLAERARAKQLQPDEVQGGTFTITNHGISGSLFAAPIINQPQCAID
jgi:2-oxoglutarate dehydrogenase E2 component (dihydrolipoamide succinyltransferase)